MNCWNVALTSSDLDALTRVDLSHGWLAAVHATAPGRLIVLRDRDGAHRFALVEAMERVGDRIHYRLLLGLGIEPEQLADLALDEPPAWRPLTAGDLERALVVVGAGPRPTPPEQAPAAATPDRDAVTR